MRAFSTYKVQNGKPNSGSQFSGNPPFFAAQAKLSVGKTDDPYEKEADAVADKVVQRSEKNISKTSETFFPTFPIQKKNEEENADEIQKKPLSDSIKPLVQLQTNDEEKVQGKCDECEKESVQAKISEENEFTNLQQKCEACEHEDEKIQKKSTGNESTSINTVEFTLCHQLLI